MVSLLLQQHLAMIKLHGVTFIYVLKDIIRVPGPRLEV